MSIINDAEIERTVARLEDTWLADFAARSSRERMDPHEAQLDDDAGWLGYLWLADIHRQHLRQQDRLAAEQAQRERERRHEPKRLTRADAEMLFRTACKPPSELRPPVVERRKRRHVVTPASRAA